MFVYTYYFDLEYYERACCDFNFVYPEAAHTLNLATGSLLLAYSNFQESQFSLSSLSYRFCLVILCYSLYLYKISYPMYWLSNNLT